MTHTCRHCHETLWDKDNYVRTGTRHFAHWSCAFERRSTDRKKLDFLRQIGSRQVAAIPRGIYDYYKLGEIIEAWRDIFPELKAHEPTCTHCFDYLPFGKKHRQVAVDSGIECVLEDVLTPDEVPDDDEIDDGGVEDVEIDDIPDDDPEVDYE